MRTVIIILFAFIISVLTCACGHQSHGELEQAARDFVDLIVEEKFDDAVKSFDSTMEALFPAGKLGQVWEKLQQQVGTFEKQLGTRTEKIDKYDVVFVTCKFAYATLDAKVVFNSEKQIAGLFFIPSK